MTAIADPAAGAVHASLRLEAPVERVFRALTDPKRLAQWWGQADQYRTSDWQVDLRPGGAWSCRTQSLRPGEEISGQGSVRGEFKRVEPPRLLEYTWSPSWDGFATTLVRIELTPEGAGTRLKLRHTGFTSAAVCEDHARGWTGVLGWLEAKGVRAE